MPGAVTLQLFACPANPTHWAHCEHPKEGRRVCCHCGKAPVDDIRHGPYKPDNIPAPTPMPPEPGFRYSP